MDSGWIEVTTEDIKDATPNALSTGPFGSAISSRFFQGSGIPVIRGSNLSEQVGIRLNHDDLVFVSKEKAQEFHRSIVRKGDLVFTCWGTIGQVGLIDDRCPHDEYVISNKQMKLSPDPQKANSLFLYYLFSSPQMLAMIKGQAIGSSVPGFNLGQLRTLRFHLPSLPEQQAIACILGALDDKIELNRRMNETLEAMARAIFKSWFVDFEPVRAKAAGQQPSGLTSHIIDLFPNEFQTSKLGEIPKGWRVGAFGEVAQNPRRSVSPSELDPGTPYIALEHMPRRRIALDQWGVADDVASGKSRFQKGEILFGKLRPYFHKVGIAPLDGVCSTDILVIAPASQEWFGFVLGHAASAELVNYTDGTSTGTKMPRTNWTDISRYEVIISSEPVAAAFSRLVHPMFERIITTVHQSQSLAALRDTLLPKLISGELRVRDVERIVRNCK